MWYKHNTPDLYNKTCKFIGTKDYINLRMTGIAATDFSYASGSGVYDLAARSYHVPYINASGIDIEKLPEIVPSTAVLGNLTKEAAELLGLSGSTAVVAGGVDNACMALGAACYSDGKSYTSLGAAALALVGVEIWADYSKIDAMYNNTDVKQPINRNVNLYEDMLNIFKRIADFTADII